MRSFTPCLLIAAGCLSLSPANAEDLSISATLGFESRYIFRGVQFAETSLQPAVTLSKDGFHVGAWFNLPVGDDDFVVPTNGEELDLVAGYSFPLNEVVSVDVGVTYYLFPEAMSGFGDFFEEDGDGLGVNTLEPYVALSFAAPLSPVVTLYRDFMYDTFTLQGQASHSIALAEKTSFDLAATIGYVFDDAIGADYLYGVASAGVSYAFSDASSVYAGARYGGSDLAGGSLVKDSIAGTTQAGGFWWGVGLSTSF
jgi:uncharacterized protein (TIGR02001 family)